MGKRIRNLAIAALLVAAQFVAVVPASVFAAVDTCAWTGQGADDNFSTAANWEGCDNGNVPQAGDTLAFSNGYSGGTVTDKIADNDQGLTYNIVSITGNDYLITGNLIDIGDSGLFQLAGNNNAIDGVSFTSSGTGGTLAHSGTGNSIIGGVTLNLTGTASLNMTINTNFSLPIIDGTAAFVGKNGVGNLTVGGSTFVTSGAVQINNGTWTANNVTSLGDVSNNVQLFGGTLAVTGATTISHDIELANSGSTITANNDATFGGTVTVSDPGAITQLTAGKAILFSGPLAMNDNLTVTGVDATSVFEKTGSDPITGSGNFTFNDIQAIFLTSSPAYNGVITAQPGAVVSTTVPLGFGSTTGNTVIQSGASLNVALLGALTIAEPLNLNGAGFGAFPGAVYNQGTGDHDLNGAITLAGNTTIYSETGADELTLNGAIGGTGDLTLLADSDGNNDPGIVVDGASPNTYSGTTYAAGGGVNFSKTGAVPHNLDIQSAGTPGAVAGTVTRIYGDDAVPDTATVTMHTADDQVLFGNSTTPEVIGGLIGVDGQLEVENNATLIVDQDFDSTFGGTIYNDGSISTITKRGSGKLNLTGSDSFAFDNFTYNIEGGELAFNGDFLAGSTVNVLSGGKLMGTGTVGDVTSTGGTVASGNSPGTLNVASLTLNPTTNFEQEIDGPTAGTQYDQVVSTGAVDLGDAVLDLIPTYTPANGKVFTIITGSSITGMFDNLPEGSTVRVNGRSFVIHYNATSVTLTYVSDADAPGTPDTGVAKVEASMSASLVVLLVMMAIVTVAAIRRITASTLR